MRKARGEYLRPLALRPGSQRASSVRVLHLFCPTGLAVACCRHQLVPAHCKAQKPRGWLFAAREQEAWHAGYPCCTAPHQRQHVWHTQKRGHLSPSVPAPLSDGQCLTLPRGVGMVGRCIDPYANANGFESTARPQSRVLIRSTTSNGAVAASSVLRRWRTSLATRARHAVRTTVKAEEYRGGTSSFSGLRKCVLSAPPPRRA
jgi:hypothetical protein